MLRTRLWMGAVLAILAVAVLVIDQRLEPWFPFLFILVETLAGLACFELLRLLPQNRRPAVWFCQISVAVLVATNWTAHLGIKKLGIPSEPWCWVLGVFVAILLGAFLVEMASFKEPGDSVARIALTVWITGYLGLLPSFLTQLRFQLGTSTKQVADYGTLALAMAIFVPKCGDIGAYFIGRLLGRHRMAPVLSPKKTWEGAAGGLAASVAVTIGISRLGPILPGLLEEVGFGLTVGLMGLLGDLAESLIKRDCRQKDASNAIPGFGGILDVVDAVIFAAPVAYCWLRS